MKLCKKFALLLPIVVIAVHPLSARYNPNLSEQIAQQLSLLHERPNAPKPAIHEPAIGPHTKFQQVGVDNSNNPVIMAYTRNGKDPKKQTIVCGDPYLGISSWDCLEKLSNHFNILVFDQIGNGASTQNAPTDLDGVGGQAGYSYGQQAFFVHELISALNITSPIIYVGVDALGNVGIKYASMYADDQYKLDKLVVINAPPQSSTGDQPCKLRYLTTAQAEGLVELYSLDRCTALCLLLQSSFAEPACPQAATDLFNEVVNFAATQSLEVFERTVLGTIAEDISGLMGDITIPVLYLYSIVNIGDLVTRQAQGMVFTGFCPSCKNPELCSTLPYIRPFPNCQFHTLAGKGVLCHRTDSKKVARYIKEFVLGQDLACHPCNIDPQVPVICPVCPS